MSGPGAAGAGGCRVPAGLLEKLLAAVRPEFRADVLVFEPADPVFGTVPCLVEGCERAARRSGMCDGHRQRWDKAGRPALDSFDPGGPWHGHAALRSGRCQVSGCGFGVDGHGLCPQHYSRWRRAGKPSPVPWAAAQVPLQDQDAPACLIGYCQIWAHPGQALCWAHYRRWTESGRPDMTEFARTRSGPDGRERADLASLPRQLRLELQYALQRRRDDNTAKATATDIRAVARVLASSGAASLLALGEREWRGMFPDGTFPCGQRKGARQAGLLLYARRQVADLAEGEGSWEAEYPRDTWRLRRLGIAVPGVATLQFGEISQPWLKDLAKRWTRWRISTGISPAACYRGARAVTRFSGFAAAAGVQGLHQVDRELLERYLASLHREMAGRSGTIAGYIGDLGTFLTGIRQHGWDPSLPPTAMFFPADYPRQPEPLPRALAARVMAQVEDPANLDRWGNPAYRLVTVILIRCGLRISSALALSWDCVATDDAGAPYLRYYNTKMKREALVPIDEELHAMIRAQHDRVRARWPAGTPVLFPRLTGNIDGTRPTSSTTYRPALYRWLRDCGIRDEHGRPVRLTPHQWRHTLGTTLINRDVPQHVVQKILDHDSPQMTARYARLSDKTVREHWEKARKVSATGQPVHLTPDGPLGDAAWAGHHLSRATQALPNGYCQLPTVKSCPHANSCLTCPMFATTAEFLPQHHAQRQETLRIITAAEAAARRHERTRARAVQALRELDRAGTPVTFAGVAQAAGISRSWLYTQPDIREQIRRLRAKTDGSGSAAAVPAAQRPTDASLRARLAAALDRNKQLADENTRLRRQLARALGDQRSARTRSGNDPKE